MNLGMGCIYDCSYCFLQGYQNVTGIIIPYNIEDYLKDDKIVSSTQGFFNYKRIGSGEFTDSLVFDHITNFSTYIINYFRNKKDIYFEFKTKSSNIQNLLNAGGQKNIVIAWSVNSNEITKNNEFKTASLKKDWSLQKSAL
jgi:spore photoproduct lyase